jgi:hypothetical protein
MCPITVVPAVTRPAVPRAHHDQVNNPAPIQLIVELTGTTGCIQGTVRYSDRLAMPFSGWSELFAALLAAVADAGEDTPLAPSG